MVCACRASRQSQFGKTNPRRNVRRLFIQCAPQRIQRFQPAEQRGVGHGWKRTSEVLIHMVMRVHQPWGDKTICCVDNARCCWLRARSTNARDESVSDCYPTASNLATLVINCCNEPRVANNEIGCCAQLFSSTSSLPAWRISASRCKKKPISAAIPAVDKPTMRGNAIRMRTRMMAPGMMITVVA